MKKTLAVLALVALPAFAQAAVPTCALLAVETANKGRESEINTGIAVMFANDMAFGRASETVHRAHESARGGMRFSQRVIEAIGEEVNALIKDGKCVADPSRFHCSTDWDHTSLITIEDLSKSGTRFPGEFVSFRVDGPHSDAMMMVTGYGTGGPLAAFCGKSK